MNFKTVTHVFAVGLVAIAAFVASPAGQAVVHQYPKLSGLAAAIVMLAALYHSPKAASAVLVLALLFAPATMAQNAAQPIFSVSTQAVALHIGGQTVPATDAVGSLNVTPNWQLETHNILAPGLNLQRYSGGVKTYPAFLAKLLAKTSLSNVKPCLQADAGVVRNVPATGAATQHYSFSASGCVDYAVNGMLSVGPRAGWLNAPGFGPHPNGFLVSANLTLILGHK